MKKVFISLLLLFLLISLTTLASEADSLQEQINNHRNITLPKNESWQEHIVIKEDKFIDFRHSTLTGYEKNKPIIHIKGNIQVEIYHAHIINGPNICIFPPGCLAQAIRIEGGARVILGNVEIIDNPMGGVYVYDNSKLTIFRSHFSNNAVGIAGYDHSKITVYNSDIEKSNDDGVWALGHSKIILRDSIIHDNWSDGLEIRNNGLVRLIHTYVYDNNLKKWKIFHEGELERVDL